MSAKLRAGNLGDAEACGSICFEAFKAISSEHNFPWDLPSAEIGIGLMRGLLSNSGFYSVVAELNGKIVGSNFLDERGAIAGIGPITVDPSLQNQAIGRQLMLAVLARAAERRFAGVRLVQSAYHNRSLCLYTKLGFESREALSKIDGKPLGVKFAGYDVRPAGEADVERCNALCERATVITAAASFATRLLAERRASSSIWVKSPPTLPTSPSSGMPSPKAIRVSRL